MFLIIAIFAAAPTAAQRQTIGIHYQWGALQEQAPRRCYAISAPTKLTDSAAFASISNWPRRGIRSQLHIRLSTPKREGSAVLLRVDNRVFQLVGNGIDAWAPDDKADAEIVAAMRRGVDMVVETRSTRGGRIRDHYPLRGAATAIDAAAIACAR